MKRADHPSPRKEATKPTSAAKSKKTAVKYPSAAITAGVYAVFTVAVFVILVSSYGDYMTKIEQSSIFITGADYYNQCMRTPGGLVVWLSTFMTLTMHTPWIGAAVYALCLTAFAVLAAFAFAIPKNMRVVTIIPAVFIVTAMMSFGYTIYSMKTPGYAYSPIIGSMIALALYWVYRRLPQWWLRAIIGLLIVIVGYPLLGFYALLFAALAVADELIGTIRIASKRWLRIVPLALIALAAYILPSYWIVHIPTNLSAGQAYLAPLPRFYAGEESMWRPYMMLTVLLVLLAALRNLWQGRRIGKTISTVGAVVAIISCLSLLYHHLWANPKDANFDLSLRLERYIRDGQWQKAVAEYEKFSEEPTRLNVVYAYTALMRTGEAPEKLFRLPIGNAPFATARAVRVMHEAGAPLIGFNLGLTRYAYRMTVENMVEHGLSVERLETLIKCALLNGDNGLAEKYIATLRKVPTYGAEAEKYSRYLADANAMRTDRELAGVIPLQVVDNSFINDNGRFEGYIWPYLSKRDTLEPATLEQAMIGSLLNQDLDTYIKLTDQYLTNHKSLPVHFQEGVLAWALINHTGQYKNYPIDPALIQRFNRFIRLIDETEPMGEATMLNAVLNEFGGTYWAYFMYKNQLNVI